MLKNRGNILISIVIPTYNRGMLICDALESVKNQTYRPIEVIVIDDGSQDNTRKNIEEWVRNNGSIKDFEIKYYYQSNQGGNVARNEGIHKSSAEYVAFLDSDDLWQSNKLEKQIQCFEKDEEVGAVYCGICEIYEKRKKKPNQQKRQYPKGWILNQMIICDVTAPTSTYIVKKEVFNLAGYFDIELKARQDWDMWIRISQHYKIDCVEEALVFFRHHDGIRTKNNPENEVLAYKRIMKKYEKIRKESPVYIRQASLSSYYRRIGRINYHFFNDKKKAFLMYARAIIMWPFMFDNYAALLGLIFKKNIRMFIHTNWNKVFGKTSIAIKSH